MAFVIKLAMVLCISLEGFVATIALFLQAFFLPCPSIEDWHVDKLIDRDNMEWNYQVVKEVFTDLEAFLILKLPLSLLQASDRLVWHHDKIRIYTVKSVCHTARTSLLRTRLALSSVGPVWVMAICG